MAPDTCISESSAIIHIHIRQHMEDASIQGLYSNKCYQPKSLKYIQEREQYKVCKWPTWGLKNVAKTW